MKISTTLLVLFFQISVQAQNTLGLNDITILLPLPQTMDDMNQFLSPSSEMVMGQKQNELLPKIVYKRMPTLNVEIDQEKNYQNNLKVIGIRFDPCFMEGFTPTACQPQVRLVWQPIVFKTNGRTGVDRPTTMDTALHTFYNLNAAEWSALMNEVKAISSFDVTAPLQIHPVLTAEGFSGLYWKNLKNIILKYAGKKNLVRTTIMVSRNGFVWAFRGVDLVQGQWIDIEIPTMKVPDRPDVTVVNDAFFIEPSSLSELSEFRGGATLLEFMNEAWFNLITDSKKFRQTQTEEEIKAALGLAFQIENPNKHNPATTGCVNCHVAQAIRLWGEANFKSWDFNKVFNGDVYLNSRFDLTNTSVNPARSDRLRGLGYFGDEPIFSQRVINETAQILNSPL